MKLQKPGYLQGLEKWNFRDSHGGELRKKRKGRKARPLAMKKPIHLVFKAEKKHMKKNFRSHLGFLICKAVIKKYSQKFYVRVEQVAICGDHIHIIVRLTKRSLGQNFFRVVAGQIAQQFKNLGMQVTGTKGFWKARPFTRIVRGFRAYKTLKNYVQLNLKEASGLISYKKDRLRGLNEYEWSILWT